MTVDQDYSVKDKNWLSTLELQCAYELRDETPKHGSLQNNESDHFRNLQGIYWVYSRE